MKRIAIDMDDVLADATQRIIELYNKNLGTNFNKTDFDTFDWHELIVPEEYLSKVRNILFEPGFFASLAVIPDSVEVVKKLQKKYEVFIVSAAMEFPNSLLEKSQWLDKHFPFIHWKNRVMCGDKSIIAADIIIDDHTKNLENFKGELPLLYDAPHNRKITDYQRVTNWKEIETLLL